MKYILVLSSPQTEEGYAEFSTFTRGHGGELVRKQDPTPLPAFPHRKMELMAPCNGIFCVATKLDDNEFYLCNPATRECLKLPERPFGFHSDKFPRSGVNYVVRTAWGFGVDQRTDEMKVVSVMYYGTRGDRYYFDDYDKGYTMYAALLRSYPHVMNHGIIQLEIYDVGSGTWREVEVVLPDAIGPLVKRRKNESYVYTMDHWIGSGLFFNGCIHWLYNALEEEVVLSFDLSSETMRAFKFPLSADQLDSLIVLGDSLAMVVPEKEGDSLLSIWVMEEYGVEESWVKRFSLPPFQIFLDILHTWKDDDGDLLLFQAADPNIETLVSCNTSEDGYHTYPICDVRQPYLTLQAIVVSEQTLVSVGPTTSVHTLDLGGVRI